MKKKIDLTKFNEDFMDDKIINFYDYCDNKPHNNYNYGVYHLFSLPFRMLLVGTSGSFKTNYLANLLYRFDNTFSDMVLVCKNPDQPLYELLKDRIPGIEITKKLPNLDDFAKREKDTNKLLILDDILLDNEMNKNLEDYFIRSRTKKVSLIYLSQSFYKTPLNIRRNITHLVLLNTTSRNDLSLILRENTLGTDIKEMLSIFDEVKKIPTNSLCLAVNPSFEEQITGNGVLSPMDNELNWKILKNCLSIIK